MPPVAFLEPQMQPTTLSEILHNIDREITDPTQPRLPLLETREQTHGNFALTSKVAQDLKNTYRYGPQPLSSAQYEALDMICTKIARIMCGDPNHPEHWIDITGYAELGREACK